MTRLAGRVGVLVFNPPYVPTPSSEVALGGIEAAWAGGVDGREVCGRFVSESTSGVRSEEDLEPAFESDI